MKRRLYQLDVFTTTPFAGNPIAVVIDGDGLPTNRMQAIAREMNLSETVFVQKPTSDRALARLRIFTTQQELPLAGHPVIGTWFLLALLGVVPAQEGTVHILQQTGAGILPVEIDFEEGLPAIVTMTQKPAAFRPARMSRSGLARALGLKESDFDMSLPLEYVSTAVFSLMVPLKRPAALKRITLDLHALLKLLDGKPSVAYCFALDGRAKAVARGMLPWHLMEDPATGSAAGALGGYLVRHEKLALNQHFEIVQGVEMGRPSRIHVEVRGEAKRRGGERLVPRVGGTAIPIFEAMLEA